MILQCLAVLTLTSIGAAAPQPTPGLITVRTGDTLTALSARYGVSVTELRQWNTLKGDTVQLGQILRVRAPQAARPASVSGRPAAVTVTRGQTLTQIGKRFGVSVTQLKRWNGLTSDALRTGQALRLTPPAAPPTTPATVTVRAGETLTQIGRRFKVSAAQLKRWNGLTSDALTTGQRLRVTAPPAPTRPATITVRRGDTLRAVAARQQVSAAQLKRWNGLKSDALVSGQVLRLTPPTAAAPSRLPAVSAARSVTVARGDTLSSIGRRAGVSAAQLQRWNALKGDSIQVGQRLRLDPPPVTAAPHAAGPSVTLAQGPVGGVPVTVVNINLNDPKVFVTAVLPQSGLGFGATLARIAARSGATAVINGGYFHPVTFIPAGDLVIGGRFVFAGRVGTAVAITPDNRVQVHAFDEGTASWRGFETVIANGPYVLRGGQVWVNPRAEGYRDAAVWGRAKRSAIGVRSNRNLFFLSTRAELTLPELAAVMRKAGARDAIVLDGGSSTGLVWRGRTLIEPARKLSYGVAVYASYSGQRHGR
ncbi:LysM peptidoglycan-binding domain-containing protein [Deinococcus soli (ex Cha et al. 2016)]|uniref:LysM repeat protein n=2 Tax=Deinococcus soli (ex Cha et al. 2016) TaxID=1309411 RepID=A0ACC6KGJ9_9DEIO|nr:LysM peptidoglycan-binding domain-containing protein [Deinococcus soli (ex Cha et al. 2016)]MDR6218172.1 LysM repeat protein [Deinococcus soli (ex Cha et al. 2016)]MDR6328912.1 LysM repeat protein [Deinococcus soli (ex Cha et al. 2016)]MDR6751600.1 LysM repeat protein [Deinococcus soli (ex Cha et al. 2016)]